MNRREVLSLLSAAPLLARAQTSQHPPVNLDEHGMSMPMPKLAGEDAASAHLVASRVEGAGSVVPILTRAGSNLRWGSNTQETVLTPETVRRGLRKAFTLSMPGDARGCEAQPLIVPAVETSSGRVDLCVCATMANDIWAFDAQNGNPVWMVHLGKPIRATPKLDAWMINQHIGILSTGVIDGYLLYLVTWESPDGTAAKASHWFHGIDLRTGQQPAQPIQLTQPSNGPLRKQRASLLLVDHTVYIAWGTIVEIGQGDHGYITAVDTTEWRVQDEMSITPDGSGGGIWQAGAGLVADGEGNVFCMSGNGSFDPTRHQFSQCFLKVTNFGRLAPTDWWTAYADGQRDQSGGWDDMDLGSGGPVLIPELDLVLGAGKDGIAYAVRASSFGRPIGPGRFDLLKAPPTWFTYFPGFGVNAAPQNPKELDRLWGNRTHHQHGSPIVWKSDEGYRVYCWGENSQLRAWSVDRSGVLTFLANSRETASSFSPVPPGGMPGGMMTLSANGGKDGVLWACVPDLDANKQVSPGRIFAFDAARYQDGILQRLWMSDDYTFNKFNLPVVSGGRVYVPTYDANIDVYSL